MDCKKSKNRATTKCEQSSFWRVHVLFQATLTTPAPRPTCTHSLQNKAEKEQTTPLESDVRSVRISFYIIIIIIINAVWFQGRIFLYTLVRHVPIFLFFCCAAAVTCASLFVSFLWCLFSSPAFFSAEHFQLPLTCLLLEWIFARLQHRITERWWPIEKGVGHCLTHTEFFVHENEIHLVFYHS